MARGYVSDFKNNSIKDISGTETPTALVGTPTFTAGKYAYGINLSNSNCFKVLWPTGSIYFDNSGGKAFAMWVNAAAGTTGVTRVLHHGGLWKIYLQDASGNVAINVAGTALSSSTNICDGAWHHVVVAYTSSNTALTIYIDGVQKSTVTIAALAYEGAVTSWFGANNTGGEWANATISDLTVWPDPIASGDVAAIMANPTKDLRMGAYSFDADPNGVAIDSSENNNNLNFSTNATFPTGHTNTGLRVSSQVTLPITTVGMDRLHLALWANLDSGKTGELICLLKGTTPCLTLSTDGSGNITGTVVLDSGTTWTATTTGGTATVGNWHHISQGIYSAANTLYIDGAVSATSGPGGGGANATIISGITNIRVNPGVVIDDLRVIANLITDETGAGHDQVSARLMTVPVSAPVSPILRGDGYPMNCYVYTGSALSKSVPSYTLPVTDFTAPTAPSNLIASNITTSGFSLSWTTSTDASGINNYDIAITSGGVENIAVSTASTSYPITGLSQNTAYPIRVRARDNAGNVSAWASTTVTTAAPLTTPLSAYNFNQGTGSSDGPGAAAAIDSIGGRNITTNTSWNWVVSGKYGRALRGDTTSNSLPVPNFTALDSPSRTVSAWCMPATTPGSGAYWAFRNSTSTITFGLYDTSTTQLTGRLNINGVQTNIVVTKPGDATTNWHHYAMTYDGTTAKLYVDGVLGGSATLGGALAQSLSLNIVDGNGGNGNAQNLRMDDLRFYNFAQTAAQIQADMATPVGDAPLSAYNFNEGTGTSAADKFGGRNITTISSANNWTSSGKYGSAVLGAQNYDSITIPTPTAFDTTTRTVSAWCKPATASGGGYYWSYVGSDGNTTFGLNDINSTQVLLRLRIGSTNTSIYITKPGDAATAWHHYAMSYDGTTLIGYLDGVQAVSQAVSGTLAATSTLNVMKHSGAGPDITGLQMDDLRIYNYVQTPAQIAYDMTSSV